MAHEPIATDPHEGNSHAGNDGHDHGPMTTARGGTATTMTTVTVTVTTGGGAGSSARPSARCSPPHSHDASDSIDGALESSAAGIRAVKISLLALGATAIARSSSW